MAKKGFYPFNVGGLDCVYIKVALDKDKIQVSGSGGGS